MRIIYNGHLRRVTVYHHTRRFTSIFFFFCLFWCYCPLHAAALVVHPVGRTLEWQCRWTRCPVAAAAAWAARGPWARRRYPAVCLDWESTGPERGSCWPWGSLRWSWEVSSWPSASQLWPSPHHPGSGTPAPFGQVSLWVAYISDTMQIVWWQLKRKRGKPYSN